MNKVISLTKVFLKGSFQNMGRRKNNSNPKKNRTSMIFLYVIAFVYLAGLMAVLSFSQITSLMMIDQEQVFLGIIFLAIAILLLIQSVISAMNVLYFSKDVEYVLPLPIKPYQIVMAKLNVIIITEYVVESIIGLIPLIIYGILTGAGFLYYAFALILLVVFPILPIVIACLLVMVIMSFAKFTRNRDAFQVIATMMMIFSIIAIQFAIQSKGEITGEKTTQMLVQANGLVENISQYFINIKPAIQTLTSSNILTSLVALLKVIGLTALSYGILVGLGQKIYLKGAIGNQSSGKKSHKKIQGSKAYRPKKIGVSYVLKEIKILFRNPIFFMQCVLPAILMPVLILGISLVSVFSSSKGEMDNLLRSVDVNNIIAVGVVIGIIQFFSMMIYVSATAISRDGLNATFTKYIPVSLYKQFIYKAIPNVLISMIMIITVLGIFWYITKVSILLIISIFIIAILLCLIQSYLMEIVDLKKPKLDWDSEYAVVKQNMNLIWPAVFGLFSIMIVALMTLAFYFIPLPIGILCMILVFGIISWGIDRYVYANQNKLFDKIF